MFSTQEIEPIFEKDVISGDFVFDEHDEILMDRDFSNKKFLNLHIKGGDFCSGIFRNCIFENVVLEETAFPGVNFDDCTFIDCRFIRIQSGFLMKNCKIEGLVFE